MSSKIIVVSTRPPSANMSGGMAPAVKRACDNFDQTIWYAVGKENDAKPSFTEAASGEPPSIPSSKKQILITNDIPGIEVRQIIVDAEKWDGHYNRASNGEVWPGFHDLYDRMANLSTMDFYGMMRVNDLLAKEIAKDLEGDNTTPIWVQDYHHFLLPALLRKHGVTNPIILFNHIPLPDPEKLKLQSVETQGNMIGLIKGLLSCNAVNFQTAETARRFMQLVGEPNLVDLKPYESIEIRVPINHHHESVLVGHYPISIDTAAIMEKAKGELQSNSAKELASKMVAENIFINFERCDYTKGILPRLRAFEKVLKDNPDLAGKVQIVIGAEPTRTDLDEYLQYAKDVKTIIDRINTNDAWSIKGQPAVILLPKHVENADVLRLMRNRECNLPKPAPDSPTVNLGVDEASHGSVPEASPAGKAAFRTEMREVMRKIRMIGTVTPHRDGMNLVAKEFVAAQDPENAGVLILSAGAGAAAELGLDGNGAIIYNPNMPDGITGKVPAPDDNIMPIYHAMLEAVRMPQEDANRSCARMQAHLKTYDIGLWAEQHKNLMTELSANQPYFESEPAVEKLVHPSRAPH